MKVNLGQSALWGAVRLQPVIGGPRFRSAEQQWDQGADVWNRVAYADPFRTVYLIPSLLNFISPTSIREKHVIDLGCGEGILCREMIKKGAAKVLGVDISRQQIDHARRKTRSTRIQYRQGDVTRLGRIPEHRFDTAISSLALMYIEDKKAFFAEAARVLKPGGDFYLLVKHPFTFREKKKVKDGQDKQRLVFSNGYFEMKPFTKPIQVANNGQNYLIMTRHYPYTLTTLLDAATESGFQLARLSEPPVPEEATAHHPDLLNVWRQEPFGLLLHLKKGVKNQ